MELGARNRSSSACAPGSALRTSFPARNEASKKHTNPISRSLVFGPTFELASPAIPRRHSTGKHPSPHGNRSRLPFWIYPASEASAMRTSDLY
jgi:hypothetical protein